MGLEHAVNFEYCEMESFWQVISAAIPYQCCQSPLDAIYDERDWNIQVAVTFPHKSMSILLLFIYTKVMTAGPVWVFSARCQVQLFWQPQQTKKRAPEAESQTLLTENPRKHTFKWSLDGLSAAVTGCVIWQASIGMHSTECILQTKAVQVKPAFLETCCGPGVCWRASPRKDAPQGDKFLFPESLPASKELRHSFEHLKRIAHTFPETFPLSPSWVWKSLFAFRSKCWCSLTLLQRCKTP